MTIRLMEIRNALSAGECSCGCWSGCGIVNRLIGLGGSARRFLEGEEAGTGHDRLLAPFAYK